MEFLEHLNKYLKQNEIDQLEESLKNESKHALLLNTNKMSEEALLSMFPHLMKHPIVKNAYLYEKDEYDLGKSIFHSLGCFYLQEPSAMIPAFLLNPKPGDFVLDLCAAPGGKSMQTSLLMDNKGLIISNDIAKNRAFAISENSERLGRGNLLITNNDFSLIYTKFLNHFDKIILDAPCSGSGMFRKDDKMIQDWSYQKVLKYAEIQKELVLMSYQMLKPGGTMVYSTCSFSYEEDEEVIDYLLDNSDAQIIEIENNPLYYKSQGKGIHLLPSLFPGEGHYIALIKKPGTCLTTHYEKAENKSQIKTNYPNVCKYGDYLFAMSEKINTKLLNIVRYGVKIGELNKDEIKYDHHYAHFVHEFSGEKEISFEDLLKYYQGESLNYQISKGYVLLKYQGINVDIAKSDGRIIKNRLPKGLRRKYTF
ncbi:MAG: NOL1/NOP2/sun family putative RNA methylase [Bacilli bacterium]|nr:NOL1/NOP2/sun family putative RNA methylase [Bacilli bacterium]